MHTESSPDHRHAVKRFARSLCPLLRRLRGGILLAVSGGADSTALVRLVQMLRDDGEVAWPALPIRIGHVHHGIRGGEADEDAAFVAQLASECGLELLIERVCVPELAARRRSSVESTAREVRYAVLERWACERSLDGVATGHNAGDQEETVLFRIVRGSGLRGLAGMSRIRRLRGKGSPFLVRPLLSWSRQEILEFLDSIGQGYRTDSTNLDLAHPRNALRHRVLPLLKEMVHPAAGRALTRLALVARRECRDLDAWGREKWEVARTPGNDLPGSLAFSFGVFAGLRPSVQERLLRRAFGILARETGREPPPLYFDQMRELSRRLARAEGAGRDRIALKGPWAVELLGDTLLVKVDPGSADPQSEVAGSDTTSTASPTGLEIPGTAEWKGWVFRLEILHRAPSIPVADPLCEVLDADSLANPLTIRARRRGETFHPLGAPGNKTLKECFRECGVAVEERDGHPLVVSGERVAWVVGHRIAHPFRITAATHRWARITATPPRTPETTTSGPAQK